MPSLIVNIAALTIKAIVTSIYKDPSTGFPRTIVEVFMQLGTYKKTFY